MIYKLFQISATLFWGWQSYVDIIENDTIEKIVEQVKKDLKKYLKDANLLELMSKVDEMKLHSHENLTKVFNKFDSPPNEMFYLCDHC